MHHATVETFFSHRKAARLLVVPWFINVTVFELSDSTITLSPGAVVPIPKAECMPLPAPKNYSFLAEIRVVLAKVATSSRKA